MYSHIEIKSIKDNAGKPTLSADLFVDGHRIKGVRSMKLTFDAGDVPTLTVDLNALDISVDSKMLLLQKGIGQIERIDISGTGTIYDGLGDSSPCITEQEPPSQL